MKLPIKWVDGNGVDINPETFKEKGYYDNPKIIDTDGDDVLGCDDYNIINDKVGCSFIIKAVNSHYDLIEALKIALVHGDFQPRVLTILENAVKQAEEEIK